MGGRCSKSAEPAEVIPESVIPPQKKYDVVYITSLLTARADVMSHSPDDHVSLTKALAACEALRDVSDSYAYSEEAITAGSVPALLQLVTQHQDSQQTLETNKSIGTEKALALSHSKDLALACVYTLLYMLQESSAPQLFGQALAPILPQLAKDESGSNASLFAEDDKREHKEYFEEIRVCLNKLRGLVRCYV